MPTPISSSELRSWALSCATEAENLATADERRAKLVRRYGLFIGLALKLEAASVGKRSSAAARLTPASLDN
jgi:hypothetical protein